jgi:hypothetical protein
MSVIDQVAELLARQDRLAARCAGEGGSAGRLRELRSWQAARLAASYADLQGDPHYARAIAFFLSDLYGPKDIAQRDRELMRAWRFLRRVLPRAALEVLACALELQVLTAELDTVMVDALAAGPVSDVSYAAAYRAVGRRAARLRQIDLVIGIGNDLKQIVSHAWIGRLLRAAHAPAHAAGFGVLQDFLERGYGAFRDMPDAGRLLEAVRERERRFLKALFAGADEPVANARVAQESSHERAGL